MVRDMENTNAPHSHEHKAYSYYGDTKALKRAIKAALKAEAAKRGAKGGRAGTGSAKRRDVDYSALGKMGAEARSKAREAALGKKPKAKKGTK